MLRGYLPKQRALGDDVQLAFGATYRSRAPCTQPRASCTRLRSASEQRSASIGVLLGGAVGSSPCPARAPAHTHTSTSTSTGQRCVAANASKKRQNIWRRAERDLLPGGVPNVPWRRLAYQIQMAPTLPELARLYRENRHKTDIWSPRLTALVITRLGTLLYPKAIAAMASSSARDLPPDPDPTPMSNPGAEAKAAEAEARAAKYIEGLGYQRVDFVAIVHALSDHMTQRATRQVLGFHLCRLVVVLSWTYNTGERCDILVRTLVFELMRVRSSKLATVAALEPPLFARTVRALAVLCPRDERLWVALQRLTLAALMQGAAERQAQVEAGTQGVAPRLWGSSMPRALQQQAAQGEGEGPKEPPRPVPDASTTDLANMAFGFAASGHALPVLFDALRDAVLSRPLPREPETIASLMWAWAKAGLPPGYLAPRAVEAYGPLLSTAPARPTGRMLWALGMMGLRHKAFLAAASKAIVTRDLTLGSPQELVNVVWAMSQLGWTLTEEEQYAVGAERARGREGAGPGAPAEAQGGRRRGPRRPAHGEEQDSEEEEEEREGGTRQVWTEGRGPQHGEEEGRAPGAMSGEPSSYGQPQNGRPSQGPGSGQRGTAPAGAGGPVRLQPVPAQAMHAAEAARARARAQAPVRVLDPGSPHALYRHLATCFLHGRTGPNTRWSTSIPQVAVLMASFARAGYGSRHLFYTLARMAVRRAEELTPNEVSLMLPSLARVRVRHDALFDIGCSMVCNRSHDFAPRQLADVMWAVQAMQPRAVYAQLTDAVRRNRNPMVMMQQPLSPLPPQQQHHHHHHQPQQSAMQQRQPVMLQQQQLSPGGPAAGAPGAGFGSGVAPAPAPAGGGAMGMGMGMGVPPPPLLDLYVPSHLLEDHDWDLDEEDDYYDDGSEEDSGYTSFRPRGGAGSNVGPGVGVGVGPGLGVGGEAGAGQGMVAGPEGPRGPGMAGEGQWRRDVELGRQGDGRAAAVVGALGG